MDPISVKIPKLFDTSAINSFLGNRDEFLLKAQSTKKVVLNFSETKYLSQLGTLVIARFVDELIQLNCSCSAYYGQEKSKSVIRWFLVTMGLINDKNVQDQDYLKRIRVDVQRCFNSKESLVAVNKLMHIIRQEYQLSKSVLKAVNWAFWEAIDNAGLHGYRMYDKHNQNFSAPVYFSAFNYEKEIEIAILDVGQGIRNSFISSGQMKYQNISNKDALELSIREHESGHPKGSPGFGLYGCAEIARETNGKLVIISGTNHLTVNKDTLVIDPYFNFNGTMLSLEASKQANIKLEKILGPQSVTVSENIEDLLGEFNE